MSPDPSESSESSSSTTTSSGALYPLPRYPSAFPFPSGRAWANFNTAPQDILDSLSLDNENDEAGGRSLVPPIRLVTKKTSWSEEEPYLE